MTENLCEEALENMSNQLDYWRKLAEERGRNIADLTRELEQQKIDVRVLGIGAIQGYREEIKTLLMQRDQAREDVKRLESVINNFLLAALQNYAESIAGYAEWNARLDETEGRKPLPHVVAAIRIAIGDLFHKYEGAFTNVKENAKDKLGLSVIPEMEMSDAHKHPDLALEFAWEAISQANIADIAIFLDQVAYGLAHDPCIIADQILRECKHEGEPKMETLQKLSQEWMQNNLKQTPKLVTLQEALKKVQAEANSGQTRREYCDQNDIPERTMRKYQEWRDALESAAKHAPQAVTEA